jgi:hypothetical protein
MLWAVACRPLHLSLPAEDHRNVLLVIQKTRGVRDIIPEDGATFVQIRRQRAISHQPTPRMSGKTTAVPRVGVYLQLKNRPPQPHGPSRREFFARAEIKSIK